MPTSPLLPADPATIGRYVLLGRVASGGMGIVYLGREDGRADSLVVVKTARPDLGVSADFVDRLRSEARLTAALARSDPRVEGLARFVEADAESETPWIATEYVPGPSLHEAAHGRRLPDDDVDALAASLAETIAALHRADVAHRDVKPANVVLGPDGARLVDLGLARRADMPPEPLAMGSPGWSPPEQHDDTGGDPRPGDVHGWAMSVAYAACGRPAFGVGPAALVTRRMLTGEPRLPGVPDRLRALLTAALRPDPLSRPTADDLVDGLASAPWLRLVPPSAASPAGGPATVPLGAGEPADPTEELAAPTLIDDGASPERSARSTPGFPVLHRVPAAVAAGTLVVLGAVALGHGVTAPAPTGQAPAATRSPVASPSPSASRSGAAGVLSTPAAHRTVASPAPVQHGKSKQHRRKH